MDFFFFFFFFNYLLLLGIFNFSPYTFWYFLGFRLKIFQIHSHIWNFDTKILSTPSILIEGLNHFKTLTEKNTQVGLSTCLIIANVMVTVHKLPDGILQLTKWSSWESCSLLDSKVPSDLLPCYVGVTWDIQSSWILFWTDLGYFCN